MANKLLIAFLYLFCGGATFAQPAANLQTEALKLIGTIEKYHINPPSMDSSFSARVFDELMDNLDPGKQFFTPEDSKQLKGFQTALISGLNEKTWIFPDLLKSIYIKRIKEYDSLLHVILAVPLDLKKQEAISWDKAPSKFSHANQEEYTRKWLKYRVLSQIFANDDSIIKQGNYSMLEAKARAIVLKSELRKAAKLLAPPESTDHFISSVFLNAIASSADPHSSYFSTNEKSEFESKLKSETLSFGIQTNTNDNFEMKITALAPGSPAWKSNAMHKGDLIVSIQPAGKEKTNVADLDPSEIDEILTSPQNIKIDFFIRRPDGTLKTVQLAKAKIELDENIVKSYVLKGALKIGYISLPDFYTQFENTSQLGCANDVAKECIKLQKENIDGLIIDLRNNGGGAVKEAIDLAGLFIDYGPLCIIKEKGQKPTVVKDFNRGMAFSGPLAILINKQSASASEIFAAAMQDYKRAVIIGSRSFGKATGQVIVPCDTTVKDEKNAHGFVKLTDEKIYRITGKSNQQTGISPDIHLPDILDAFVTSESGEKNSLPNDSVKKSFFASLPSLGFDALKEKSSSRIENSTVFNTIRHLSDSLRAINSKSIEIPIDLNGFAKYYSSRKNFSLRIQNVLENKKTVYSVETTKFDNPLKPLHSDFDNQYTEIIKKDLYIQESYNVISDMVSTKQIIKP